jgi:hypothetical protein
MHLIGAAGATLSGRMREISMQIIPVYLIRLMQVENLSIGIPVIYHKFKAAGAAPASIRGGHYWWSSS